MNFNILEEKKNIAIINYLINCGLSIEDIKKYLDNPNIKDMERQNKRNNLTLKLILNE